MKYELVNEKEKIELRKIYKEANKLSMIFGKITPTLSKNK